jgi:cell division protein FtsA
MKKDDLVAVLDIGSEKFVCSAGIKKDDKVTVLAVSECYSKGLEKGSIVSIEKAAESIVKIVEEVESVINKRIESLFIGIKGEHVHTDKAKGIINITRTNKEITEDDKKLVLENIREQVKIDKDRAILEIVPIVYTVDSQKGIIDPKGMDANHLELDAYIITASTVVLNNIYKCLNNTGFKVSGICYNQIALVDNCILTEEKEIGVILIDMGSKLTDISVYKNNRLFFSKELMIGGDLLVNDVAFGLQTSLARARELIINYGSAVSKKILEDKEIKFFAVDGITEKTVKQSQLADIINARLEEMFKAVKNILLENGIKSHIPSGVVLTGGTAKLKYIQDVTKEILNMPVRLGPSQDIVGDDKFVSDTSFTSVIGLIRYFFKNREMIFFKRKTNNSLFPKLKKALEGIF